MDAKILAILISLAGSGKHMEIKGHRLFCNYNLGEDVFVISCGNEHIRLSTSEWEKAPNWCATMVENWFFESVLKKGTSHVSGQAAQANSGNPAGTQSGTGVCKACRSGLYAVNGKGLCPNCDIIIQGAKQNCYQLLQQYQQQALNIGWQQKQVASMMGQGSLQTSLMAALSQNPFGNIGDEFLPPIPTSEIRLGEIVGWRGWFVTKAGFLESISADIIWAPGEVMEGKTDSRKEHNGVYAFKTKHDFLNSDPVKDNDIEIYGSVHMWGDIIEHELGYRAQFAKVASLDGFLVRPAAHKIAIKEMRERYGVAA